MFRYLIPGLTSFLISFLVVGLLRRASLKQGIFIKNRPLVGGIGLSLAFLPFLIPAFWGLGAASFIMLAVGILDDWKELSVRAKLTGQVIATAILIAFGVKTQIAYIGNILNTVITFIWIIGITNSFNHLDVMDGVAGVTAITVSGALLVISVMTSNHACILLNVVLLGAISGFIFFNFPPAKVYLGNSGSHFIGFIIAAVSLMISYAPLERKVALLSPLLALGFPIFDTVFLILVRLKKKRLPFLKSDDHLVLRFIKLGFSKRKALLLMFLLALFFAFCAVLASRAANLAGIGIIAFAGLVSLTVFYRMSKVSIDD